MGNNRPKRRGRPPKPVTENRYLNSSKNFSKTEIDDDDDEESNQSSSKYQTRSGRKSQRSSVSNSVNGGVRKKRRKRKKGEESEEDFYNEEDEYEEEPVAQLSDEPEESESNETDHDDLELEEEEEAEEIDDANETGRARRLRPKRDLLPKFFDDQQCPKLIISDSSEDLLISGKELIQTLSIYEILRHFHSALQLTPFRFEDFCVSLLIDEQNYLLSEIHIQLLRTLLREDDLIGTQHGPQDLRDSINIYLYLCDHVTWPEVLRVYLSADLKRNLPIIKDCLESNYPYTTLARKLNLLEFLCDEFLNSQAARDIINNERQIEHDEYCRLCQKTGEMLMCDTCTAVFHLYCLEPPLKQVPEEEWICPVCKQNQVVGVTDCVSEYERHLSRQEPIGYDRHGRLYWFLNRRIIVQDPKNDEKVWYYSTRLQFDELLSYLDSENYESDLCNMLYEMQDEIYRQMAITEKLTKTAKGSRKSYVEAVNEELFFKETSKLKSENLSEEELNAKRAELESKLTVDGLDELCGIGGVQTRLKTGTLQPKIPDQSLYRNRASIYNSISTINIDEDTVIIFNDDGLLTRTPRKALPADFNITTLFKLGFEGNYRNYQNIYSVNPQALNRNQMLDEREKRLRLSHKFSLTPVSDLKWASYTHISTAYQTTSAYGSMSMLINILRQALLFVETNFSSSFMHPHWSYHRNTWARAVNLCSKPEEFGLAMYLLEGSMKPLLFNYTWHETLGFNVLKRSTQLERDELKKKDRKGRGETAESIDGEGANSKYFSSSGSKLKLVFGKLKHQIWKQKGEEYRLSGIGGWQWICSARNQKKFPSVDVEKDLSTTEDATEMTDEIEKAKKTDRIKVQDCLRSEDSLDRRKHYPKIYNSKKLNSFLALRLKMLEFEKKNKKSDQSQPKTRETKETFDFKLDCYSPICCHKKSSNTIFECYSPSCRKMKLKQNELVSSPDLIGDEENVQKFLELQKIVSVDSGEKFSVRVRPFNNKVFLPPSKRFQNGRHKTIMAQTLYEMRRLARKGGLRELTGFNYNAKLNYTVWPYALTPRPFFRTMWLYRTHNVDSLHCVALQLRVFWASIRWDELAKKPPPSGTNTITTENEVQTIEICKRKDLPPFGLKSQYLIRKIIVPMDLPSIRQREVSTPNRSGLRQRRKIESSNNKGPRMTEEWVEEENIELWEIKLFAEKLERQQQQAKQRAAQEQRQLEWKRKIEENKTISSTNPLNKTYSSNQLGSNTLGKTMATKLTSLSLFQNRTNRLVTTPSNLITSSGGSSSFLTLHPQQNGPTTIKIQAQGAVKTPQLIIRNSPNTTGGQQVILNSSGALGNRTGTTFLVRTPSSASSRPIILTPSMNGSIIRTATGQQHLSYHPHNNIRTSVAVVSSPGPKKISTVTTANAILTTSSLRTIASSSPTLISNTNLNQVLSSSAATTTTINSTPTVNVNQTQRTSVQCLPLKTLDGKTHLITFPTNSLTGTNQTLQLALGSNNQFRLVSAPATTATAAATNSIKIQSDQSGNLSEPNKTATTAFVVGGNQVLSPGTFLLSNNRLILQNNNTTPITVINQNANIVNTTNNRIAAQTQTPITKAFSSSLSNPSIIVKTPSNSNNFSSSFQVNTSKIISSPLSVSVMDDKKKLFLSSPEKIEKDGEDDFVVTSEMTQEVVRKALLNANQSNMAPELAQKLIALQRHHKEHQNDSSHVSYPPLKNPDFGRSFNLVSSGNTRLSTSRGSAVNSRSFRANRYDNDDFIYDYPKTINRSDRHKNYLHQHQQEPIEDEDETTRSCRFVIKQLLDRIEKDEKRERIREIQFERRQKKAAVQKLKYRHNHVEIIRRSIMRRKALFNLNLKALCDSKIDGQLSLKIKKSEKPISISAVSKKSHQNQLRKSQTSSGNMSSHVGNTKETLTIKRKFDRYSDNETSVDLVKNNESKNDEKPDSFHSMAKRSRLSSTSKSSPEKTQQQQQPSSIKKKTKLCICNNRSNSSTTMIRCDKCKVWFHIACVKISKEQAESIGKYFCPYCLSGSSHQSAESLANNKTNDSLTLKNSLNIKRGRRSSGSNARKSTDTKISKKISYNKINNNNHDDDDDEEYDENEDCDEKGDDEENALYCFCQKNYDQDQFYIFCDQCKEWLHGRCVGITSSQAEKIAEYTCPKCEGPESENFQNIQILRNDDYVRFLKIFKVIQTHKNSWPFREPVDGKLVPDYYAVIKEPMDLRTIENRLNLRKYQRLSEIIYDMYKIFDNCRYYNDPQSPYYVCANSLEQIFKIKLKTFYES